MKIGSTNAHLCHGDINSNSHSPQWLLQIHISFLYLFSHSSEMISISATPRKQKCELFPVPSVYLISHLISNLSFQDVYQGLPLRGEEKKGHRIWQKRLSCKAEPAASTNLTRSPEATMAWQNCPILWQNGLGLSTLPQSVPGGHDLGQGSFLQLE